MDTMDKLALFVKCERTKQRMNQRELAKKAGVTPCSMCRIENGERNMRIVTLTKIANALGYDLYNFLKKAEEFK